MKKTNFYTQGTMDVLLNINITNDNLHTFSKKVGLSWVECRKIIYKLSQYNLVEINKNKGRIIFNLTDEGIQVRNNLFVINQILIKNKNKFINELSKIILEDLNEIH